MLEGQRMREIILTLTAAIISGILATGITIFINQRNEKIRLKQTVVDDIFGYKYQLSDVGKNSIFDINSKGFIRAMNRIPIIFHDEEKVLKAYDKFYDTTLIADQEERKKKTEEALLDLLKVLCYSAHIKCNNWNDSRFKRVFNI